MKKLFSAVSVFLLLATCSFAQADSVALATAKSHMRSGDYNNAIMILNRVAAAAPTNLEVQKDLAFSYYLKRDYVSALRVAKPLVEHPTADVQSFQILGMVYKAIEERKDCEKMYKAAIKKFPNSGVLYNEYGEMIWTKQSYVESVKLWEKGIQVDPNYSGNYYNAAKYYYFSADKVWGLIYGEIFVNLESYTKRTDEIRGILMDGYKKLFSDANLAIKQDTKNEFVKAFLANMQKNSNAVAEGISPETLLHLRTRFITDWFRSDAARFPHRIFDLQKQLLSNGMFNAYNQWLFGGGKDSTQYNAWTASHPEETQKFTAFQRGRIFRMVKGQYYQKRL